MTKKILLTVMISCIAGTLYFSCRKTPNCDTCRDINKPPIANAGRDTIIVLPIDSVSLNGGSSTDPDGNIEEFLWSKISGPVSFAIADSSSSRAIVRKLTKGVYRFELKITDNGGLSAADTLMITVDTAIVAGHEPIADAGSDQHISTNPDSFFDGVTSTLDASNSLDPDNNISSYRWTIISSTGSCALANADAVKTTATFYDFGQYRFELTVTDQGLLSSRDTVNVSINRDSTSRQPRAAAGPDQVIFLPENSIQFDGSLSWDADGDLVSYQWTKISGPSSFNILNPTAAKTEVKALTEGNYQFELRVADLRGQFSSDTVDVTVIACATGRQRLDARLLPFATLPEERGAVAVGVAANKIVFAGGMSSKEPYGSARVDIYDVVTKTWTIAQLSLPRYGITAVSAGDKILFAGGASGELGDALYQFYSEVDIYDAASNSWSVSHLGEPQQYMSTGTVDDKVFFAGGNTSSTGYTNKVEIYDVSLNSWSTKTLSESKQGISVVTADDKIYFAGGQSMTGSSGFSSGIDIYDNGSNTWSTATLSQPRLIAGGGTIANNKIFWAGGYDHKGAICSIEIMDKSAQTISFDNLSNPGGVRAVSNGNKIGFFGYGTEFDIYDLNTETWSIGVLPDAIELLFSINNTIYISGRNKPGQILTLEF